MLNSLLSPPLAFLVFVGLSAALYAVGRYLAGPQTPSELKSSLYTGGEAPDSPESAPGYRPFFLIALFFAILHLGVLMIGYGGFTWMTGIYLIGLILALIALVLG
jgi:NADH:ubiquinone oxidoreductase subunit 3 (subunit A)